MLEPLQHVIVKLLSGEQVMAVLQKETDEAIELLNPMLIRLFAVAGDLNNEHVTAVPYCKFADDNIITLHKRNVLFMKNLHFLLIPHFTRLVNLQSDSVLISRNSDGTVKKIEDINRDESLTLEEVRKRIKLLQDIAEGTYVDGNDTRH